MTPRACSLFLRPCRSVRRLFSTACGPLLFAVLFMAHASAYASYPLLSDRVDYDAGRFPNCVAIGDLNGDGKLDVATTDQYIIAPGVWVLLGNGDGTLLPGVLYPIGVSSVQTSPRSVVIADVNHDGKPDLVAGNGPSRTDLSVFLGNGDGTFAPPVEHDVGFTVFRLAAGDLNHDGVSDLVVPHYGIADKVSVLLGTGDGSFAPRLDYETLIVPLQGDAGFGAEIGLLGDLDNDGDLDVVVGGLFRQGLDVRAYVSVLLGNGDGTLTPSRGYPTGGLSGQHLALGDLNGDGNLDLVSSREVRLGKGDGTFAPSVEVLSSEYPQFPLIADLNDDDRPDLVGDTPGGVSVLLGNGNGTFGAATSYATLQKEGGPNLGIGDLDGDGALDLVASGGTPTPSGHLGSVSVLVNTLLPAKVRLEPRVIDRSSRIPWVMAHIEVPGFGPATIDVSSLRLEGIAPASTVVDYGTGDVGGISVRFSRAALDPLLESGENEVRVAGALVTGRPFAGRDRVRVIDAAVTPRSAAILSEEPGSVSGAPPSVIPNPFQSSGVLAFTTSRPGPASVAIFDVRGRRVRALLSTANLPPGDHAVRFDGRGQEGDPLPAAVYFYRIMTVEGAASGRIAITR